MSHQVHLAHRWLQATVDLRAHFHDSSGENPGHDQPMPNLYAASIVRMAVPPPCVKQNTPPFQAIP
jgi:hypothetical protein